MGSRSHARIRRPRCLNSEDVMIDQLSTKALRAECVSIQRALRGRLTAPSTRLGSFCRSKRHDGTFHHGPAVVSQVRLRITDAVLPAGKQFVVTTIHDCLFILVMEAPFIFG